MSSVYSNNLEATNQILVSGYAVTSGVLAGLDPAVASSALASGNAALVLASSAQASGNAGLSVGAVAQASGNAALVIGNQALASGNAALALGGPSAAAGLTSSFTAASNIASGYAVGLDANGRAVAINQQGTDSISVFATNYFTNIQCQTGKKSSCYFENNGEWLFGYRATTLTNTIQFSGQLQGAALSGNSLVFGSPVTTPYIQTTVNNASANVLKMAYLPNKQKAVAVYNGLPSAHCTGFGVNVSNLSPAVGTPRLIYAFAVVHSVASNPNNDTAVVVTSNNNYFAGNVVQISGTLEAIGGTPRSYGGPAAPGPNYAFDHNVVWSRKRNIGLLAGAANPTAGYAGIAVGFSAGATELSPLNNSYSPGITITPSGVNNSDISYDYKNDGAMFVYVDSAGSGTNFNPGYGKAVYLQFTENNASVPVVSGPPVVFNSAPTYTLGTDYDNYNNRFVVAWTDGDNLKASLGAVTSGYGLQFSSPTTALTRIVRGSGYVGIGCAHASGTPYTLLTYGDNTPTVSGFACVVSGNSSKFFPNTDNFRPNVIGVAQTSATSGTAVTVALPGSISRIHTGLTAGQYVYPNYTTSGISSDSSIPAGWGQDPNWAPIGVAISSTEAAIINPIIPQ